MLKLTGEFWGFFSTSFKNSTLFATVLKIDVDLKKLIKRKKGCIHSLFFPIVLIRLR